MSEEVADTCCNTGFVAVELQGALTLQQRLHARRPSNDGRFAVFWKVANRAWAVFAVTEKSAA
jgi:hypothetical protein